MRRDGLWFDWALVVGAGLTIGRDCELSLFSSRPTILFRDSAPALRV